MSAHFAALFLVGTGICDHTNSHIFKQEYSIDKNGMLGVFQPAFIGRTFLYPTLFFSDELHIIRLHFNYLKSFDNMNFSKLVPNIFYVNISDGLKLFVDCLEFTIGHDELNSVHPFCVVEKDGLRINLFQDESLAKEHNPEFRLVTDDIEKVYSKVSASHPQFLHPNLNKITLRPWGAREFALKDNQLGVVIQQW